MKPRYTGKVTRVYWPCSVCKKDGGAVWRWIPNTQGFTMQMDAHTKCFHGVWRGEK